LKAKFGSLFDRAFEKPGILAARAFNERWPRIECKISELFHSHGTQELGLLVVATHH
jgi:hypothetical protein